MNTKLFLPLALALPMFASCEKAAEAGDGIKDAVENFDIGDMTPEAMTSKATEMAGGLTTAISGLTDKASIESFAKDWMPKLDQLGSLKDALGDKMPSMDSLKGAVTGLTEKFSGDAGIMAVLGPILEKLKGLVG